MEQVCEATGGPCRYTGRDMRAAHAGMRSMTDVFSVTSASRITDAEFDALVEDLVRSLDKLRVPTAEQRALLGLLGGLRPQVVGQ